MIGDKLTQAKVCVFDVAKIARTVEWVKTRDCYCRRVTDVVKPGRAYQ